MSQGSARSFTPSFGFGRDIPPVVETIARVARAVWPIKTARNLAARTSKTHRAAEDWLSLRTGMNADALADILRSDQGDVFLEAIMADCPSPPSWWPVTRSAVRAHAIERRLDDLRSELEEARLGLEAHGTVRPVARRSSREA